MDTLIEDWSVLKLSTIAGDTCLDLIHNDLKGRCKMDGTELFFTLKDIWKNISNQDTVTVNYKLSDKELGKMDTSSKGFRDVPKWIRSCMGIDKMYWRIALKDYRHNILLMICREENFNKDSYSVLEEYATSPYNIIKGELLAGNSLKEITREYKDAVNVKIKKDNVSCMDATFIQTDTYKKFCYQIAFITKLLKKKNKEHYKTLKDKDEFLVRYIQKRTNELLLKEMKDFMENKFVVVTWLKDGCLIKKDQGKGACFRGAEDIDKIISTFLPNIKLVRKSTVTKNLMNIVKKHEEWYDFFRRNNEDSNIKIIEGFLRNKAMFTNDEKKFYKYDKNTGIWSLINQRCLYDIIPSFFSEYYNNLLLAIKRSRDRDSENQKELVENDRITCDLCDFISRCDYSHWNKTIFRFRSKIKPHFLYDPEFESKINGIPYLYPISKKQVVNFITGELSTLKRRYFFTKCSKATGLGDPHFIEEFTSDIQPKIANRMFMQDTMALCLTGEKPNRRIDIWIGKGKNGKSVMVDMLFNISPFTVSLPASAISGPKNRMECQKNSHTAHLNVLKEGRCAIVAETKKNHVLDEEVVKSISSGDHIAIRELNKEYQKTFVSVCKIIIHTNNLISYEKSSAIADRMHYLDFPQKFKANPTKDNHVLLNHEKAEKTKTSYNDILAWLVIGTKRYYAGLSFVMSNDLKRFNKTMIIESDVVQTFLNESLEVADSRSSITIAELLDRLKSEEPSQRQLTVRKFTPQVRCFASKESVKQSHGTMKLFGYKFKYNGIYDDEGTSTLHGV